MNALIVEHVGARWIVVAATEDRYLDAIDVAPEVCAEPRRAKADDDVGICRRHDHEGAWLQCDEDCVRALAARRGRWSTSTALRLVLSGLSTFFGAASTPTAPLRSLTALTTERIAPAS